jgi:hypothetical protein
MTDWRFHLIRHEPDSRGFCDACGYHIRDPAAPALCEGVQLLKKKYPTGWSPDQAHRLMEVEAEVETLLERR